MELPKRRLTDRFTELVEEMYLCMRSGPPDAWSDLELTMPQVRTLLLLHQGPQRMSEIANYLGTTVSSATSMVDRLLSKQLVDRVHDTTDRRVVTCRLSTLGRDEVERFWRIGRCQIEGLAEALDVQELETVVHAFETLSVAVKRQPASVTALAHAGGVEEPRV